MTVKGLLRFGRRNAPDENETTFEDDAAHAWWNDDNVVHHRPNPKKRGPIATEAEASKPRSGFEQYFTNESLFARNQEPSAGDPLVEARALLGVDAGAAWKAVTVAYRRQALEHHPDRHAGDDSAMIAINQAYAVLRTAYGK